MDLVAHVEMLMNVGSRVLHAHTDATTNLEDFHVDALEAFMELVEGKLLNK